MCKRPGLFADQMEFLEKYFNECDLRNMSREEYDKYEYSLKIYRDLKDNEYYWENEEKEGETGGRAEFLS